MQITQAFGQQAAKAVGDYANTKMKEAQASGNSEDARNWAEGGAYRVAAHAAAGALGGGLGGALGAAASASLMPHIADAINQLDAPDAVKRAVATAAAAGLGAIAGSAGGAASGLNVEVNNRQLHQSEYDLAKKNAKLVAQKLGISEQEAEGRIIAEMQRNSDQQTATAAGGIHDYQIRSVIGCQNLNCNGYKNDPQYANHDANSEWIAPNQEAYNVAQTQLDQGKTYSDLVAGNIKKDPVGATLAGAGMMGLGVVTGAGLPALSMAATGAGIGSGVNGAVQLGMGQPFDWFSFVMAGATGAASSGMGFIPSILINTGGALTGSGVQGQNPNGAMAGAAAGTAIGFPIGSKIEGSLGNMMNPWYRQEWKDVGIGMSVWVTKSPLPSWLGTAAGNAAQEKIDPIIQNKVEGK